MMQARWGSHGDYEIIALCPNSPQECFDLMIDAFNLSEQYRVPVLFMMDECVGHMTEKVVIPAADDIEIFPRRYTSLPPSEYLPFKAGRRRHPGDGQGGRWLSLPHHGPDPRRTRLSGHDLAGAGEAGAAAGRERFATTPTRSYATKSTTWRMPRWWSWLTASPRAWRCAPSRWRARKGIKAGLLRPIVRLAFPGEAHPRAGAEEVKAFVVVEMNYGQMVYEVERCAAGKASHRARPARRRHGARPAGHSESHPRGGAMSTAPVARQPSIPSSPSCAPTACRTSGARAAASGPRSIVSPGRWWNQSCPRTRWRWSPASAARGAWPAT